MIKIENTAVYGWEPAIRGMRNPMNSWGKMDTNFSVDPPVIGPNDLKLMKSLSEGGPVHSKYLRMLTVTADITAPLYWWKEFDTMKVGTVANSCSTMHKIHSKEFELDDFSHEHLNDGSLMSLMSVILILNLNRVSFLIDKNKDDWWQMIQLLPSSYNQKRTVQVNYEVLKSAYQSRKHHKLDEWREFCGWVESLPYSKLITNE